MAHIDAPEIEMLKYQTDIADYSLIESSEAVANVAPLYRMATKPLTVLAA